MTDSRLLARKKKFKFLTHLSNCQLHKTLLHAIVPLDCQSTPVLLFFFFFFDSQRNNNTHTIYRTKFIITTFGSGLNMRFHTCRCASYTFVNCSVNNSKYDTVLGVGSLLLFCQFCLFAIPSFNRNAMHRIRFRIAAGVCTCLYLFAMTRNVRIVAVTRRRDFIQSIIKIVLNNKAKCNGSKKECNNLEIP